MVLAAGYGTRLRPLTDHLPKPLAPLAGRPLLDLVLDRLAAAGVTLAVVNGHHLADRLRAHLETRAGAPSIRFHHEPEILGTAGPLHAARDLLAEGAAFLVHNADVLCDADLAAAAALRAETGAEGVLLLTDLPRVNSVRVGADGRVRDVAGLAAAPPRQGDRMLTYTGVAVLARRFLARVSPGPGGLAPLLARAAADGALLGLEVPARAWSDLGTPRSYLEAHAERLATGTRQVVATDAVVDATARLEGFAVVGAGASIGAAAVLSDCVVLPGAAVPARTVRHRCVLGPGWEMPAFPPADAAPPAELGPWLRELGWDPAAAEPLAGQASDRRYWRLHASGRTAILLDSAADASEFDRTLAMSRFLHAEGLGGAAVLAVAPARAAAVLEDLGEVTLGAALRAEPARWRELYGAALAWLAELQARTDAAARRAPLACDRVLDHDGLRGESRYFAERFLVQTRGIDPTEAAALAPELDALAEAVASLPRRLIHRDYQSTNILLRDDRVGVVDVQGLRLGPAGYDAASLLRDPYLDLAPERARTLLADWEAGLRGAAPAGASDVILAGLQRSLQALGAYGFLSHIRGKREFARWIPAGLRQLRAGLADAADAGVGPPLPRLTALIENLVREDP